MRWALHVAVALREGAGCGALRQLPQALARDGAGFVDLVECFGEDWTRKVLSRLGRPLLAGWVFPGSGGLRVARFATKMRREVRRRNQFERHALRCFCAWAWKALDREIDTADSSPRNGREWAALVLELP